MNWKISAPGKTFLVGEYAALQGGPSLILTAPPRFTLHIKPNTDQSIYVIDIKNNGPAMQFIDKDRKIWHGWVLDFNDPYHEAGGFGASTAQLVMLQAYQQSQQGNHALQTISPTQAEKLIADYQHLVWDGQGTAPSGADFIAQWQGGISYLHRQAGEIARYTWPFTDLVWVLIPTRKKLATYQHLRNLPPINYAPLQELVEQARQSFLTNEPTAFIAAVGAYGKELQQQQLVTEHTRELLMQLQQCPEVLAAKGCGAMGADVVLALINKVHCADFKTWLQQQKLHSVFMGQEAATGVEVRQCAD